MASSDRKTIHRNSENGRIVSKEYAERHPRTTERERVLVNPPTPPKSNKK